MKLKAGELVDGYVYATSESPEFFHCQGVVLGYIGDDLSYELQDKIGDECADGDLVIEWARLNDEPDLSIRIYHPLPLRGSHVWEQQCYGGYWEQVVIVRSDQV